MKNLVVLCAAVAAFAVPAAQALPILGTFDSRTDPSIIIGGASWAKTATNFEAFGMPQWGIEAAKIADGTYWGLIWLFNYNNVGWFGTTDAGIFGYLGMGAGWTLDITDAGGGAINLVMQGSAVLDHYVTTGVHTPIAPTFVALFELGFTGVPAMCPTGNPLVSSGVPDYFTVTIIPEPATLGLLALGGLLLRRRIR